MFDIIILAGGKGTRLKSVVSDVPKPMAIVNGKPFLYYIFNQLKNSHVDKTVISLGFMSEKIIDYINKENILCKYTIEEIPLLTGGAIRLALEETSQEDILILNGDTYFDLDLVAFYEFHKENNNDISIAVREMFNFERYGSIQIGHNNSITAFNEKVFQKKGFINTGYIFIKNHVINNFQVNQPFSFENDLLNVSIDKFKMGAFIGDGTFIDIGIPEDYFLANKIFSK
jgi:D-glycero-alpha-D-manno-heptose 1-phosphate guanylyltransferase